MKLELIKKDQLLPGFISFFFNPEQKLEYKAGQFLRYHIANLKHDNRGEDRFFSIASAPFENIIQLTTKFFTQSSTFKAGLNNLKIGDFVEAVGPYGSFIFDNPNQKFIFVAGGIGITPFRSILLQLDHDQKPLNVTLLYANRNKEILFQDELETLARKHPEFKIYYLISDKSVKKYQLSSTIQIIPGKIDQLILKSLIIDLQSIIYISGPQEMVADLEKKVWNLGIPKENTKRDYFPGYRDY